MTVSVFGPWCCLPDLAMVSTLPGRFMVSAWCLGVSRTKAEPGTVQKFPLPAQCAGYGKIRKKSAQGNCIWSEQDRDKKNCRREMSATPYTCVMRGAAEKIRKTPIGRRTKPNGEKLTAGRSDHRSRKASSSRRSQWSVKRF